MDKPPIRILIVDDHAVVRKGLALVLRLEPDFEVVGEAGNGREALQAAPGLRPDLVLLDLVMPEMDGEATARALKQAMPQLKVMILTGTGIDERVLDLIALGVDGYVFKEIEPHELRDAIRAVARGEAYLDPAVVRRILDRMTLPASSAPEPVLTPRELEVLQWMSTENTYRQIGNRLHIGEETVRSHAKRILSKLNQPNRAQAVLAAVRNGLIELPGMG